MLRVTLVCVSGRKERHLAEALEEYQKRMESLCRFSVVELPPAPLDEKTAGDKDIKAALAEEARRIDRALPKGAIVAALCVEGKGVDSGGLAAFLERAAAQTGHVAFVIGSSHGLAPLVVAKADLALSLSAMTLPHQLARLVLTEQIYRGCMINAGRSYHK